MKLKLDSILCWINHLIEFSCLTTFPFTQYLRRFDANWINIFMFFLYILLKMIRVLLYSHKNIFFFCFGYCFQVFPIWLISILLQLNWFILLFFQNISPLPLPKKRSQNTDQEITDPRQTLHLLSIRLKKKLCSSPFDTNEKIHYFKWKELFWSKNRIKPSVLAAK